MGYCCLSIHSLASEGYQIGTLPAYFLFCEWGSSHAEIMRWGRVLHRRRDWRSLAVRVP